MVRVSRGRSCYWIQWTVLPPLRRSLPPLRRSRSPLRGFCRVPSPYLNQREDGIHHDVLRPAGASPALKLLFLNNNKIGGEGLRHLAKALARDGAPALRGGISLQGNPGNKRVVEYALKHRYLPEQLLDGAFLVAHLADAKALDCGGLGWGHEEARRLAAALEHATAQGALKSLEVLDLSSNEIGDEGLRHLSDALARGAAPALKDLTVWGNKIGDEGIRHLADALVRGAAPALEELYLERNQIGDEGVRHLGDALARSAAPKLWSLNLDRNQASHPVKQAVQDALKQRRK